MHRLAGGWHGKVRALLRRRCPDLVVPDAVWHTNWIAHVTAWGQGEQAVLDYLARYVFRIAITNARIVGLDDAGVTVAYRNRKIGRQRTCRLGGDEFIRRFLQHVLPRGFHKVRYFGLWHRPRDSDRCSGDEAETLFDSVPIGSLFARENSLFFAENFLLDGTASPRRAGSRPG